MNRMFNYLLRRCGGGGWWKVDGKSSCKVGAAASCGGSCGGGGAGRGRQAPAAGRVAVKAAAAGRVAVPEAPASKAGPIGLTASRGAVRLINCEDTVEVRP